MRDTIAIIRTNGELFNKENTLLKINGHIINGLLSWRYNQNVMDNPTYYRDHPSFNFSVKLGANDKLLKEYFRDNAVLYHNIESPAVIEEQPILSSNEAVSNNPSAIREYFIEHISVKLSEINFEVIRDPLKDRPLALEESV